MSVATAQVLQIAHKEKACIEKFLRDFTAGTAFHNACRDFATLDGYDSRIVQQGCWYMTTVVFAATNWNSDIALEQFDDGYLVQIGVIDDRQSDSTVFSVDEAEIDLPPLNGTASRERIWGWSKPREATNATRKEGTG